MDMEQSQNSLIIVNCKFDFLVFLRIGKLDKISGTKYTLLGK